MSILPMLKTIQVVKALLKAGFKIVRQNGSHIRLQHITDSTRQTTVPQHSADIPRWLLRKILKQSKIEVGDFIKLISK